MFRFLFPEHRRGSACTYYRQEIPARAIRDFDLASTAHCQHEDMGSTPLSRMAYYMRHDAIFFYAVSSIAMLHMIKSVRRFPIERKDGKVAVPPVFFGDIDDNIHFISPMNPKFKDLGTRDQMGNLFKKGEEIWIVDEENNRHLLWKDGENKWDVRKTQHRIKVIDALWKRMDGMSFSTPRLETYYKRALRLTNTYTFPNSVCFDDYPDIPIHQDKGTVKVMWQGGDAHYGDWYGLRPVLPWTCSAFPEVRWVIFGSIFKFIHSTLPKEQLLFIDWVPYDAYKVRLATIDFDFMVVPLADNKFNECKSAIKWYEASALPRPKPVLAAKVPPFSDEIIDGETGLLYGNLEEFKVKFEALVRDGDLRTRLAANAKQWVRENRDVSVTIPPFYEWIVKTIDSTRKARWPDAWTDAGL